MQACLRDDPTIVNAAPLVDPPPTDRLASAAWAGLTYRDAGVDIKAGEQLVERIKPLAQSTRSEHVLGSLGGFAGLCSLPSDIEDPVLVSGTDGRRDQVEARLRTWPARHYRRRPRRHVCQRHHHGGCPTVVFPGLLRHVEARRRPRRGGREGHRRGVPPVGVRASRRRNGGATSFYAPGEYDWPASRWASVSRKCIIDGKAVRLGDQVVGCRVFGVALQRLFVGKARAVGRRCTAP